MQAVPPKFVIPAKAGIHRADTQRVEEWIPAFAGMTGIIRAKTGDHRAPRNT
jgi:hypothetical protein